MVIRYAAMGFDLTAITDMLDVLVEEGQVPLSISTLDNVKALYRY